MIRRLLPVNREQAAEPCTHTVPPGTPNELGKFESRRRSEWRIETNRFLWFEGRKINIHHRGQQDDLSHGANQIGLCLD